MPRAVVISWYGRVQKERCALPYDLATVANALCVPGEDSGHPGLSIDDPGCKTQNLPCLRLLLSYLLSDLIPIVGTESL